MRARCLMLLLAAAGCSGPGPSQPGAEADDATLLRVGSAHRMPWNGPCAGEGWGQLHRAPRGVHVRVSGSDSGGDGSWSAPYATIERAWEDILDDSLWPGHSPRRLVVGPGEFTANLDAYTGQGLFPNQKIVISGCSADETTLRSGDDTDSVLHVAGARKIEASGLTLSGGTRAVRVEDGGRLVMRDARVEGSRLVGAFVHDEGSELFLHDTEIRDTVVESWRGWGVAVLDGRLEMTRGGVYASTEIGIFGDHADIVLTDVEVVDTQVSNRIVRLGRALHLQNQSTLEVDGGWFQNSWDAGIFLLDVGSATVNNIVIDVTSAGVVIDIPSAGVTGDAIVVKGGQDVSLYDNLLTDSDRAALLVDSADVWASGNTGGWKYVQRGGQVTGEDGEEAVFLESPLQLNDAPFDLDALFD